MTCPKCQAEITVPELRDDLPTELVQSPKAEIIASKPAPAWGRELRRVFLYSLIGCFAVGAATAIIALRSFDLGETGAKLLLTTLSLGSYSLTGLCCVVIAEKPQYRIFGGLGIATSIAGALFVILTNWEIVTGWEIVIRGRFSFLVVAIAFGHAALLLMIDTKKIVWCDWPGMLRSLSLQSSQLRFLAPPCTRNPSLLRGMRGALEALSAFWTCLAQLQHPCCIWQHERPSLANKRMDRSGIGRAARFARIHQSPAR